MFGWPKVGAFWCCMDTPSGTGIIRRSISLPAELAEKIDSIAANRHASTDRTIIDLLADAKSKDQSAYCEEVE